MQYFNRIAYSSESHTILQIHLITRWYVEGYTGRQIICCLEREERIPTRCKNIDDLLSIPDVDY